jgi:3-isopropylmalate dehydrogenase
MFCEEIFAAGGAVLSGPGGGRYVYDLRRRFDLFCKFVPVKSWRELARAGRIRSEYLEGVDMLIVRDNAGGVYQGNWTTSEQSSGRVVEHVFRYSEPEVYRLVEVAALASRERRGRLHIIVKDGGVPAMSQLWREVGMAAARKHGVDASVMNVDYAAYEMIQHPERFDVLATPNMIGDILADLAGVLVGSRGLTFSGNFNASGAAVYQTNHGCAHDMAGTGCSNPAGQMLSLAMLLRESFGLQDAAVLIERSLTEVWRSGWRTADIAEPGCNVVGTSEMAERVVNQIQRFSVAGLPA